MTRQVKRLLLKNLTEARIKCIVLRCSCNGCKETCVAMQAQRVPLIKTLRFKRILAEWEASSWKDWSATFVKGL